MNRSVPGAAAIRMPPDEGPSIRDKFPVFAKEFKRRPVLMVGTFAALAILGLVVGLLIPKKYTSNASILVQDGNITAELARDRPGPGTVVDRTLMAREVIRRRHVMDEIHKVGGWLEDNASPLEQERMISKVSANIEITDIGTGIIQAIPTLPIRNNVIRVAFTDDDAERAFRVNKRLTDLIVSESVEAKRRQSREAYDFIDSQVAVYQRKLNQAEANLEQYRKNHPDAWPGVDTDVTMRIGELRRAVDNARLELADLRTQEGALRGQLGGEQNITMVQTRGGQLRARLAELQTERGRLLLSYTEQHPDVIRVQQQIRELEQELRGGGSGAAGSLGSAAAFNPQLYGELKGRLADVSSRGNAAGARIASAEAQLARELDRSRQLGAAQSEVSKLTRDYEVNRGIYQDLLTRRESARVAMNMDADAENSTFRIQEAASMPLRSSSMRVIYMAAISLLLAAIIPLALLFAFVNFDPRVRLPRQIEHETGLPLLGTMPQYLNTAKREHYSRRYRLAGAMLLSVPVVYGLFFTLKLMGML